MTIGAGSPSLSTPLLGAVAAYRQAIADGYTHGTSIYSHPRARVKLAKLLLEAERKEAEFPHLSRERWEYRLDIGSGLGWLRGDADEHTLFRAPNSVLANKAAALVHVAKTKKGRNSNGGENDNQIRG
jgi:hypothetical protein